MNVDMLRKHLKNPMARCEIVRERCQNKKVLDIGCVHHDIDNTNSKEWMHGQIHEVADSVLGVDYLESEVETLAGRGYNIIVGDVNNPLPINQKFDVIVVGNLIEHLSSFSGLMDNINRLLTGGGVALISTANPFYREQYFYSALKNDIMVNPEHTCWIDPITLDQLARRFSLATVEVLWVKENWMLSEAIFNGKDQSLDLFTGRWRFNSIPSAFETWLTMLLTFFFKFFVNKERRERIESRYQSDVGRLIYLKFKGLVFEIWWRFRRIAIPTSDINRHELFVSVLKKI